MKLKRILLWIIGILLLCSFVSATDYSSLNESLISYWNMDNLTGNEIDLVNGYTATETGGNISSEDGQINLARNIQIGDSEYFETNLNGTESGYITISVWINTISNASNPSNTIVDNSPNSKGFSLRILKVTNLLSFFSYTGGTANPVSSSTSISTGTWYHVVGVRNSTHNVIYVNGVQEGATAHAGGGMDSSSDTMTIGYTTDAILSTLYDGRIDELAIYNRSLNSSEIALLYQAGLNNITYENFTAGEEPPAETPTITIPPAIVSYNTTWIEWNVTFSDSVNINGTYGVCSAYTGNTFSNTTFATTHTMNTTGLIDNTTYCFNMTGFCTEGNEDVATSTLTDGLVGHWDMNDDGDTIVDYIYGNNATNNGAVANATGKLTECYDYTPNDYISAPDSSRYDFVDEFTICQWVKADDTASTQRTIQRYDATSTDGYYLGIDNSPNTWQFITFVGGSSGIIQSDLAPTTDWTHLCGTRLANGTMHLYVNNVLQTSKPTIAGAIDSNGVLNIGTNQIASAGFFNGKIDDTSIWNRSLNSTEIEWLYNSGAGLTYENFTSSPSTEGVCNTTGYLFNFTTDANATPAIITDSNVTNLQLSSNSCSLSTAFTLNGTFDCIGNENCTGVWNITTDAITCTLLADGTGSYNVLNGSSFTGTADYSCSVASDYDFNFTVENSGDSVEWQNLTITCAGGAGGGLTAEENAWLEGIYKGVKIMAIVIILIALGLFFFVLAYTNKAIGVKILGYGITAWQLLIGLYIVYLNELDQSFTEILRIDFIGLLLIIGGIGLVMLFTFLVRMINVSDPMEEETDALKWSGDENKWNK